VQVRVLNRLQQDLEVLCKEKSFLWWSGGKDSTLLLLLMLEMKLTFHIAVSRQHLTKEQSAFMDAIILKHELIVHQLPPTNTVMFGNGKDKAIAFQFHSASFYFFLIKDLLHGKECIFDKQIKIAKTITPKVDDTFIFGTKAVDNHWSDLKTLQTQHKIATPLWKWSDEDVINELERFEVEIPTGNGTDTGNLFACTNCLNAEQKTCFCPKEQKRIKTRQSNLVENWRMVQND
jgi:diphthamide synthase (EF-2-diphthine--ammonia ligase)